MSSVQLSNEDLDLLSERLAERMAKRVAAVLQRAQLERLAYTIDEAAEVSGIPRSTLRDRVSSGELRAVKRCGKWRILRQDLLKWLDA